MKEFILKTFIALIFLFLFNGLFFFFQDLRICPVSVWAAFAGVNVAYLSLFLIPALTPRRQGVRVLSATLYLIGILYFVAELATGIAFVFYVHTSLFWPVAIQTILFAIYFIVLLSSVLANDATQASLDHQQSRSDIRRDWVLEAENTLSLISDNPAVRKAVERCRDDLRGCPLGHSFETKEFEDEISSHILCMKDAALDNQAEEVKKQAIIIRSIVAIRNHQITYKHHY